MIAAGSAVSTGQADDQILGQSFVHHGIQRGDRHDPVPVARRSAPWSQDPNLHSLKTPHGVMKEISAEVRVGCRAVAEIESRAPATIENAAAFLQVAGAAERLVADLP